MIVRSLLFLGLSAGSCFASGTGPRATTAEIATNDFSLRVGLTQELVVTSNALDSPRAVTDRMTHVKITADAEKSLEGGLLGLQASLAAFQFDDLTFEDDRFAGIDLNYSYPVGDKALLRGSIGYGYEDQGDDLDLGVILLGTRTKTHTLRGALEMALALSEKSSLTLGIATKHDLVGLTEFDVPIEALRLSPDMNTSTLQLEWARRQDGRTLALISRAEWITLHGPVPEGSAIGSHSFSLSGRLEQANLAGLELAAEAGLALIRDDAALTNRIYPIATLTLARTIASGTTASFSLSSAIDTDDSDDPLGSRVHRAELELEHPLFRDRLTVSAGVFGELRDNFAFGNREDAFGTYAAVGFSPASHVSLLFRLDYEKRELSLFETQERTLAGKLGLQVEL